MQIIVNMHVNKKKSIYLNYIFLIILHLFFQKNVQDARSSVKRVIQYLNATGKLHLTLFMAENRAIKVVGIFIFQMVAKMYGNRTDIYCLRFVYHELNESNVTRLKIDFFLGRTLKKIRIQIRLLKIYLLLIKIYQEKN